MRLNKQVTVITGGASGIGLATARLFAAEGACVALVDRDAQGVQDAAAAIRAAGGDALAFSSDVGAPGAADTVASDILALRGRIDVLACVAGWSCGGTVTTTAPEDWDAVFRTNVNGTWLWARAVIPAMQRQGGGSIITFASQLALAGGRGNCAYIASKGAILSLTRTMALDYAADGIRVNAIAPAAVATPLLARGFKRFDDPPAAAERLRQRHPLGRFGQPDEIAQSALHLASSASSFTTGTTMVVDGGWLAA